MSPKQQRFVAEYLVDLNATAAYERSGYAARGNSARANAARLLTNANIASAIQAAQLARSHRTQITQDAVLTELATLDFSDVTHYQIDDVGNVGLASNAPPQAMRAVSSLRKRITHHDGDVTYDTEIKFWNKPAALRMSGQHLGLFKDQIEISGAIKVVRLPQKAISADTWHAGRSTPHVDRNPDLGASAEAD